MFTDAGAGSGLVLYQAPADRVVLVKSVSLTNGGTTSADVILAVHASGVLPPFQLVHVTLAANACHTEQIWTVLEPLDELVLYQSGTSTQVYVSGALLPLRP